MVHLYCGDGKGKTTAAVGLAVRAAGAGKRVVFAQFLKSGRSSEISVLRTLENVEVLTCKTVRGFFKDMTPYERHAVSEECSAMLEDVMSRAEDMDMLVLDEAVPACDKGVISEERLLEFLSHKPESLEVVITGRSPSEGLTAAADYMTEIKKIKHPFDKGLQARKGVEY